MTLAELLELLSDLPLEADELPVVVHVRGGSFPVLGVTVEGGRVVVDAEEPR